MICFFEKRAARRENFAAGGVSFLAVRLRFSAGGLSVFVKFGDFYSTSTVSQVKTLNKIVF